VPLDSPFYLERRTDTEFHQAIRRGDSIVLVKGPRQVGKTSLLARGLERARQEGARVTLTDCQKLTADHLQSPSALFLHLAEMMAEELDLDLCLETFWNPARAWNVNFERFLRREVLGKLPHGEPAGSRVSEGRELPNSPGSPGPPPVRRPGVSQLASSPYLVWGLDEVDRLFGYPYASEVFGLFRAWHNERALRPSAPWSRLTQAIAYATEAHLFITDLNQSPFNVGTRLELQDFTLEQVAELNRRHGSPLQDRAAVERFFRLVGGHPYLVRCGLHRMANEGLGITEIESQAALDQGPFGEHLRRLLHSLSQDPDLGQALREALSRSACPTDESFYRLRSAGVLLGATRAAVRPRCHLYRLYLEARLS
jgi:hypothetical protein